MSDFFLSRATERGRCKHRHGKGANNWKFKKSLKTKCRLKSWFTISKNPRCRDNLYSLDNLLHQALIDNKTWHRGQFVALCVYIGKKNKCYNYNDLNFYHSMLEKEVQIKPIVENKIIKIKMEIHKIKQRKIRYFNK